MTGPTFKQNIKQCFHRGDVEAFSRLVVPATRAYKICAAEQVMLAVSSGQAFPESCSPLTFLKVLAENELPLNRSYRGWTPLQLAASLGDTDYAGFLLEQGASVDFMGRPTSSFSASQFFVYPLMKAADQGQIQMIHFLINAGAQVNKRLGTGETAVFFAMEDVEALDALFHHGARLDVALHDGSCLFHEAISVAYSGLPEPERQLETRWIWLMEHGLDPGSSIGGFPPALATLDDFPPPIPSEYKALARNIYARWQANALSTQTTHASGLPYSKRL